MNRENAHLYLPLVQALADGKDLQHNPNPNLGWIDGTGWAFSDPPERYRVKPKTIRIGEFDVPEPLRVAPATGTYYYVPQLLNENVTTSWRWCNDNSDKAALARGFAHATCEEAELHARALISLTQTPADEPR